VVTHFESPSRQDPKALARAFEAQAKLVYPGFEKVRGGFLEISGETAYCLDFMSSNEAGRRRVRQVVLGLSAGSEMHVTMSCDAASNDRYSDVFKGLTASLELLNPEARAPVIGADKPRKVAPKKSRNSKVKLY
jgi:hypothetical protein